MRRNVSDPLVSDIWVVVQENEGLIIENFRDERKAILRAEELSRKCPSVRTEIAKYLIALNSRKSFGVQVEDDEEEE